VLWKRLFEKSFVIFRREILSIGTQISMKLAVCGGDFLPQVIERLILITSDRCSWSSEHKESTIQKETHMILRENL